MAKRKEVFFRQVERKGNTLTFAPCDKDTGDRFKIIAQPATKGAKVELLASLE